jgi:hypothetical protein
MRTKVLAELSDLCLRRGIDITINRYGVVLRIHRGDLVYNRSYTPALLEAYEHSFIIIVDQFCEEAEQKFIEYERKANERNNS